MISSLLEMNILEMVIILMCLACMPERKSGKTSALGRRELVAGLRWDEYVRYGRVRLDEW